MAAGAHDVVRQAHDTLLELRQDLAAARAAFTWPDLGNWNVGFDRFDRVAASEPTASRAALWVVDPDGTEIRVSYAEMARRCSQVGAWLQSVGVGAGDRVVLLLGNQVDLWEVLLACAKIGAVVIPASTLLAPADLQDRVERGRVRHVVVRSALTAQFETVDARWTPISVGEPVQGWIDYCDNETHLGDISIESPTRADDTLLLYFTSGTTARPKLVEHTQASYPVGHLSTMDWIGLQPGDVHRTISSPGWEPTAETAAAILGHAREHLAAYTRIRRIEFEFAELPTTVSGKSRPVELRGREVERHGTGADDAVRAGPHEFWESDLP